MPNTRTVSFTQSYDLEGRIDAFLAQRSSALAARNAADHPAVRVELIGIALNDRRVAALHAAATPLRLTIVTAEPRRRAV